MAALIGSAHSFSVQRSIIGDHGPSRRTLRQSATTSITNSSSDVPRASQVVVLRAKDDDTADDEPAAAAALTPTERILENEKLGAAERKIVEAAAAKRDAALAGDDDAAQKYPVDLPSPILLGTSILLAIVSTGTLSLAILATLDLGKLVAFDPHTCSLRSSYISALSKSGSFFSLLGNKDELVLGFAPTAAIVVLGYPLCFFLFYAAIVKAKVETEEDDKAFLSGK